MGAIKILEKEDSRTLVVFENEPETKYWMSNDILQGVVANDNAEEDDE